MLRALLCIILLTLAPISGMASDDGESGNSVTFSLPAIQPWAEGTPDEGYKGLLVEMVKEIRRRTDLDIEFHLRPHSRAILELEEGAADFVPTFVAPGIAGLGKPVGDLASLDVLVLGRASDEPVDSLADLRGENVGYLSGTWYGRAFAENTSINKIPVNNVAHGLRLLKRGRLKAVVATEIAIPAGLGDDVNGSGIRTLLELDTVQGKLYMSRASQPQRAAEKVARAMESMHEDGTMAKLFRNRYEAGASDD